MSDFEDETNDKAERSGSVEIIKVPLRNIRDYINDGHACGSSINPQNIAKQIEDDYLSGTLYYATTDDMKKKAESLRTRGSFPLNEKYFKTEEGPGYAYIFVQC